METVQIVILPPIFVQLVVLACTFLIINALKAVPKATVYLILEVVSNASSALHSLNVSTVTQLNQISV